MFDDTKEKMQTQYADVIKNRETVYGRIMEIHVYPLEVGEVPGNFEIDLTLDNGQVLEASVPPAMYTTIQERAFEPALFVVSPKKAKNRLDCQAILFGQKLHKFAM